MGVEMLVRRADKINPNSDAMNAMCTKRGDVIVVKETPCDWSTVEREHLDWIIISVDDLTIGDAETFLQVEQPIAAIEAQPLLKKRMMHLDLDGMTSKIKASEKAYDVAKWEHAFTHSKAHIVQYTVIKPVAETVLI